MTQLLLVAHRPLASALASLARHVYPACAESLAAVDIEEDLNLDEATGRVVKALEALRSAGGPGTEVLLLVDVPGATPCNAARSAARDPGTRVVWGVNVPMLWRTLCYAAEPLDQLTERAVEGGSRGIGDSRAGD